MEVSDKNLKYFTNEHFSENLPNSKRPLDLLVIGNIRSDINEYLDSFLKSSKSSKYVILSLSNCDGSQNVDIREAVCDQVKLYDIRFNIEYEHVGPSRTVQHWCRLLNNDYFSFISLMM